jgi:hypothetical protein
MVLALRVERGTKLKPAPPIWQGAAPRLAPPSWQIRPVTIFMRFPGARLDASGAPPFDASRLILGCFQPVFAPGRN